MKLNCLRITLVAAALLFGPAKTSMASTVAISPTDYGTLWWISDTPINYIPRYYAGLDGYVLLNNGGEYYQPQAQFSVPAIPSAANYYFEVSPFSFMMGGSGAPSLYAATGTGEITPADFGTGTLVSTFSLSPPGPAWYEPNGIGGFNGSTYIDITSVVTAALDSSVAYLAFSIQVPTNGESAVLRAPRIIASDTPFSSDPVSAVPLPAAAPMLASALAVGGLLGWRRRRRMA